MTAMATVNTVTTIIVIIMVTMVITTVMIAAMEMGNISQKAALTVVMSIDAPIDTEIISDLELYAYSADHPDHSKFRKSLIKNRHRGVERIPPLRHRDVENIRMKTGVYRGRGGHPPETLMALGYQTFNTYGHYYGHYYGQFNRYLPNPLGNTALRTTAPTKFPSTCGLEPFTNGAREGSRIAQVRGLAGGVQGAAWILSESDSSLEKKGFQRREAPNQIRLSSND